MDFSIGWVLWIVEMTLLLATRPVLPRDIGRDEKFGTSVSSSTAFI